MRDRSEYLKSWKESRYQQGLCHRCGNKLDGKFRTCADCRKKSDDRHHRWHIIRKTTGLCTRCDNPVVPGKTHCEAHLEDGRSKANSRREKLQSQGLCLNCQKPRGDFFSKSYCEECYPKFRSRGAALHDSQNFGGNRIKALERDDFRCTVCGSTRRLEVHHLDSNRSHNALDNLTTLCHSCHVTVTRLLSHPQPSKLIKLLKFIHLI